MKVIRIDDPHAVFKNEISKLDKEAVTQQTPTLTTKGGDFMKLQKFWKSLQSGLQWEVVDGTIRIRRRW
jgi:hypothetical protein